MTIEVYVNGNYEAKTRTEAVSEIQNDDYFMDWCVDCMSVLLSGEEIFEHLDAETQNRIKEEVTSRVLNDEYYHNTIEV